MKIKSSNYVASAVKEDQFPSSKSEVAMVGRSNVGKSSLINKILNRKKIAHTSSTPGKTRTINFYDINESFYLVDLPGYGFARVPENVKKSWHSMIEGYLTSRIDLKGVVMLVDLRHPPSKDDLVMIEWLRFFGYPTLIVATKADKISKGRRPKHLKEIAKVLNLEEDEKLVAFSAETGEGKKEVLDAISYFLNR